MKGDARDPRGLIQEAFRIEGIGAPECRSIFLDWALGVPQGVDSQAEIRALLEQYKSEPQDHPMTHVLQEALKSAAPPRRRGGRAGRAT